MQRNKHSIESRAAGHGPSEAPGQSHAKPLATREVAAHRASTPLSLDHLLERAGGGLKVFFKIADDWELTPAEQRTLLGDPPRTTFYKWRKGETGGVGRDTLERLSHVFGIYTALQHLFPARSAATRFLRQSYQAPPFDGRPVLAWMLHGDVADLYQVRAHLESVATAGL